jgi:steroid 5-alpha reductase family enzyme
MVVMGLGFCLVVLHDTKLCALRKKMTQQKLNGTTLSSSSSSSTTSSTSSYTIPHGGMFRYVTAPHFLGEIIEWIGYAIAAKSLAAWSFPIWTAANLVPRALMQHAWYQETFRDTYPNERRAIVPFFM